MLLASSAYDPFAGWLGLSITLHFLFWLIVAILGRLGVWEVIVDPDTLEKLDETFSPTVIAYGMLAQTIVLTVYLSILTLWRQF